MTVGRGTRACISTVVGLLCVMMMGTMRIEAFQFSVGGPGGWSIPSDNSSTLNQWAARTRFQIGDSLVFAYKPNQDSVLYVTKDSYNSCNNETYVSKYVDGHTVFKFNQSGPFYFISGVKENCLKNEKLVIVVLADRTKKSSAPSSPPAPAPSGEESPSPPAGRGEKNPTPAPTSESTPPHNNSSPSSGLIGFTGSVAVFAASYALFML